MSENTTNSPVPILTQKRFAELVGWTTDVVRGMVARGILPTKKFGRHRCINVAALTEQMKHEQ